jgi:hypothetical protein
LACLVFFTLTTAFFGKTLSYDLQYRFDPKSLLNEFLQAGELVTPSAYHALIQLYAAYTIFFYLFAVALIVRASIEIKNWIKCFSACTCRLDKKVLIMLLVSVALQIVVVVAPIVFVLKLFRRNSCETKVDILHNMPFIYDLYLLAGFCSVATLAAICIYMSVKIRQQKRL